MQKKVYFPSPGPHSGPSKSSNRRERPVGGSSLIEQRGDGSIFFTWAYEIFERICVLHSHTTFVVHPFIWIPSPPSPVLSLFLFQSRRYPRWINVGRDKIATYGIIVCAIENNERKEFTRRNAPRVLVRCHASDIREQGIIEIPPLEPIFRVH